MGNEIDTFSQEILYKKGCAEKIWKVIVNKSPRLDISRLAVICVSIPARINQSDKTLNLSILDIQDGCNLLAELKSMQPDIPLVAGNQSTAFVYAEYKDTYNGKIDEMIYFNINEGVSAGILLNGRAFTGEIGHMTIDPEGPLCTCGKRGCVESLVSKSAILREFGDLVTGNKNCLLHTICKGNEANIHYSAIREALDAGDPASLKTADRLAGKIAFCISNVICMFNPEKIVIGGGIEELGQNFWI
jgi:glucokinase